jgi:hypothetical protein
MYSVDELLRRNLLAIFGERDSVARMKELEAIWLPDGIVIDPDGQYVGLDAINHRVEELQAQFAGFEFSERGQVNAMHGIGRLAWGFGPADNLGAVTGVDIAVTRGGKLSALYAFID